MNFLLDRDVHASTARLLRKLGHDVVTVADRGGSTVSDMELLRLAAREQRILVTRDRDYGGLVFVEGRQTGIIYLRFRRSDSLVGIHSELAAMLENHTQQDLASVFVVVEPGRYRFRAIRRR